MSIARGLRSVLILAAFVGVGILAARWTLQSAGDAAVKGMGSESAQTSFMSFATKLAPLRRIELAKIEQIEVFERTSQAKLFWDQLVLPDVVVRATVPVEYRYSVELNDQWRINVRDQVVTITAPALVPGTPSPDISKLQFEVRKGSFFRNEAKVTQALQAEITSLLQQRAVAGIAVARETARAQVKEIARQWLAADVSLKLKDPAFVVLFADETAPMH